jgi:carbon storage regulator CsrA
MLILSRRAQEQIVLPQSGVVIHVLGTHGGEVRIGIEAPPKVKVLRGELVGTPLAKPKTPLPPAGQRLHKVARLARLLEREWNRGRPTGIAATLRKITAIMDSLKEEAAAPRKNAGAATRPRSLLVEDDADERELMAGLLNLSGVECDTAEDGLAALDFLATHERPDFILLDMFMPRCDGPETVARIRRDPRWADLKVFAVSGTPPRELGVKTGPGGVDAWFPKPINPQTLWELIQRHLGHSATHN